MKKIKFYILDEIKYFFKSLPDLAETPWYHWIPTVLTLIVGLISIMILLFSPPVYKPNFFLGLLVTSLLFCVSVFTKKLG